MLKTIIKRDGSSEDFIPHKVNRWVEWTTKGLEGRCNWSSIVLDTIRSFGESTDSQTLQKTLVKTCLLRRDWPHNVMAGRLYTAIIRKEFYNNFIPKVQELHKTLNEKGLMRELSYTDEEYKEIESIIDHDRDFNYAHFQIRQVVKKYSIQDRVKKISYETSQFVFMRMAMVLSENIKGDDRLKDVKEYYNAFSSSMINAPSPNYINLGTYLNAFASCCLYTTGDTAKSLAIGDHIAYTMTYMSAGIGAHLNTRSAGDKVRNGMVEHQGKLPYYRSLGSAVKANLQSGRGGACTTYYSIFDPEVKDITIAYNPRTPVAKQNRDIHYASMINRLFAKKAAKNENIFLFNIYTAPDLTEAFYSGDKDKFEELYNKYENDDSFKKTYMNARELLILDGKESYNVAVHYRLVIDEVNRHTPFLEPIYSSNLCLEICEPTSPYYDMKDLYSEEDHGRGEVALCNLAGINVADEIDDETYEKIAYYSLKMIDETIHLTNYELPHVGLTAKKRLNAAVGMIGVATYLAKKGLQYNSQEGLKAIHFLSERHMYFLIKSSLRLAKEKGVAPWMHKTKWPKGWLPIDTYKKDVDDIVEPVYVYDWEKLREEVISNGGIRNSVLVAHMPTESSSKASGVPNGIYPIRDTHLKKTDQTTVLDWCPMDGDILQENYQRAWDIPAVDMIKVYSVFQKFTDQSISADFYRDRTTNIQISDKEILEEGLAMVKYGLKSRYYQNSLVSKTVDEDSSPEDTRTEDTPTEDKDEYGYSSDDQGVGCAGGSCTL